MLGPSGQGLFVRKCVINRGPLNARGTDVVPNNPFHLVELTLLLIAAMTTAGFNPEPILAFWRIILRTG